MSFNSQAQAVWVNTVPDTRDEPGYDSLDEFLAGIERRAYVIAEIATRNPDDALDVVQDAMLSFVASYRDKPNTDWPPLFHRVLQNKIRDWYRRQQVRNRWRIWPGSRHDAAADDPVQHLPDPAAMTPERRVALSDGADAVLDAVATLPLRQQQAFLLRTWEGLDVAQTARAMGCSTGSVKTHLSRALKRLREHLEAHRQ